MSHPSQRRALAALIVAGTLAAAAPASADPVKAGPALPNELAVLTMGGGITTAPTSGLADAVWLHRHTTTDGAYRGRIGFPTAAAEGITPLNKSTRRLNTESLREHALKRSVDGRFLTFTGVEANAGTSYLDRINGVTVKIAADGTRSTLPIGDSFIWFGATSIASVTVDGSRDWLANVSQLATVAPGSAAATEVAAPFESGNGVSSIDIVDGALHATNGNGVSRLSGLPTTRDITTAPQLVLPALGAIDSAFVDTDAVAGVDTAYVTRENRGVWKYALEGGTWKVRGRVPGSFGYLTARAVDGAVEVYTSASNGSSLHKIVDTAPSGGELASMGAQTIAIAPSGRRFAGVAFAPGTGFPADTTPYPAAPPTLTPSTTTVQASLQASNQSSMTFDVADANTPASELTLTATSSDAAVLPNDRIAITGSGTRRTVTFDPVGVGQAIVTFTVKAGDEQTSATVTLGVSGPGPDPTSHYYSGLVDISAALDLGGDYFFGISDEVNTVHLFKKGVSAGPIASWNSGFPGGETDFEGVTRFGDTVVWSGSHGNNRNGSIRPERRFLAFQTISGSGESVDLEWRNSYTRLWDQWKAWDASNGHGLGANKLKFNTAAVPGVVPNAPFGFNVEGVTMAPGSQTVAWFGMRAPTITGDDGIERALILPVNNIDKLTSDAVDAQLGAPILLDLGGRSIRDIAKNANDQYLISAGAGVGDGSLQNWALYTWDGNPATQPQMVKELVTDERQIGAWEAIAELPANLTAGSRVLMIADSGDTGIGKSYGQYVTLGEPVAAPAAVTGIAAAATPGATDVTWNAADRATRYHVTVVNAAGEHAPGSPKFVTGTSARFEGLTAGTEYTVQVRAENVATRSANAAPAKVTPTQGARTATTTTVALLGDRFTGRPMQLQATISDPAATGWVEFYDGTQRLQDAVARDETGARLIQVPVVGGKATLTPIGLAAGLRPLRAVFTTANPETFLSSTSDVPLFFIDSKPRVPRLDIVSITGDRVAGERIAIKVKLRGFTRAEVSDPRPGLEFNSRINGQTFRTRLDGGENTPENPSGQYGYATMNDDGEATFYTRALPAGTHRISAWFGGGVLAGPAQTAEIPLTIAPAGAPSAAAPAIKIPKIAITTSGPGIVNQPQTLTARISDKTLAGTVQFFYNNDTAIGPPVPVVDGVATRTGTIPGEQQAILARFEPAADRATTASPISLALPLLRGATAELPFGPATPSTTTLAIDGERVAGEPLTATVDVKTDSTEPYAERDLNGYVELLAGGREIAMAPVLRGQVVEPLTLPAGVHTLQARFVPADARRAVASASAEQAVTVVAKTDAEAPVGGSVPATLALTLGAPAKFEPFVPGVAKEYTAGTTATVISTAGDAALTVSEPGHLTNGAFSLPQPLQVAFSTATWTAPVSNANVDIAFKQAIGANDALRTGTYSKTLTFTLSTTTP